MVLKDTRMTMILPEDLFKHLSKYDTIIYEHVKSDKNEEMESIKNDVYEELDAIYELSDKTDHFSVAKERYLREYVISYFRDKVIEFNERIEIRLKRKLTKGRSRVNCTAKGGDGLWRWFGHQFYL